MTNIPSIGKGFLCFLIGYFTIVLFNYAIPPIITALSGIFSNSDFGALSYLGIIIIWVILGMFLPNYYIVKGLSSHESDDRMISVAVGVLIFLFTLALTVKGWFMVTALANISQHVFITVLYWIGFFIIWVQYLFIVPFFLIIKNRQ